MESLLPSQRASLRSVFAHNSRRRGEDLEPTLDAAALARILSAAGLRTTEADAHALISRSDVAGRGGLSEPDFLQLFSLPISEGTGAVSSDSEVDSLFDRLVASTSSPSGGIPQITKADLQRFLDDLRRTAGIGATVPIFTEADIDAIIKDAGSADTMTRQDFHQLMGLQLRARELTHAAQAASSAEAATKPP